MRDESSWGIGEKSKGRKWGRILSKHIIGMYASLNIIKNERHEALKFFHGLKKSSIQIIPPTSKQCLRQVFLMFAIVYYVN